MAASAPPPRRLPLAAALLAVPTALALAALVAAGALALWPALIALVAVTLAVAGLLAWHFRAVAALRGYVEALRARADDEPAVPEPPAAASLGLDPGLGEAIAAAARESRRRGRELRAAMAGREAVLSALPDPLVLVDAEGRVLRTNPAARALFGPGLEGRDLATVLRYPDLLAAADAVLAGGPGRVLDFAAPGGLDRHYTARVEPLAEPGPGGTATIVSLHDITAIKRAEQMRADFVANASHELRTPLSSLLGFLETLQGAAAEDAEARARFLEIMLQQARRMQRLVDDLLSLSRIELIEHTPPIGRVELARVIEEVAGALELRAREKDMEIVVEAAGLPAVAGEADQLTQVFENLVDNAVKYGRPGTAIRIEARAAPGGRGARRLGRPAVAVAVADAGEGIAREHIPRLTERFYRVDTARSRELGGTGLGLAIVKHIVNRHRGALEVDSTPGAGSRFTVYLPTADSAAGDRAAQ